MSVVSRGFGRHEVRRDERLPPGQYDVGASFPVLSAGPTPRTPLAAWDLTVQGEAIGLSARQFRAFDKEGLEADFAVGNGWELVSIGKLGSWFLLMIISYVLVSAVNRPAAMGQGAG